MKRCVRCILPENYPGIRFNSKGVCSFCYQYKTKPYLGKEKLAEKINKILGKHNGRNTRYDCVVGVSGGRDSTYILWYVTKKLGLRAIAYSADNCFTTEAAIQNVKGMSIRLNTELVVEKNTSMKKCIQHHVRAFMHRPTPSMVGFLCTGCKLGIDMGLLKFSKEKNIPLVILGGSPLEVGSYKTGLLRSSSKKNGKYSLLKGYLFELNKNPKWIMNPAATIIQFKEYYHHFLNMTLKKKTTTINPFYRYLKWDEKKIDHTLKNEIGWKFNKKKNTSTWKTDCYLAPLRKYLYKQMLGFNDIDDHLSALVRGGQISRKDALSRLEKESSVPAEALSETCRRLRIERGQLEKSVNQGGMSLKNSV